ncbi:ribosome silencing factor [Geomonas sp. Red69]|uniref:Ribosomal silencing factor RsfS n=1 Tax=Geomonas diazotrophica TaxID=2843197 RepID=A0ABX8JFA4_9BACT|nr:MULTISPECIES: ribosome silencing factor [Geomonas]MBU5638072.1 ribosome silencing factor [Geomonas diazotrophica]QWV97073.1 ribosome silencing factor [Geomonas nitrogeniifigens]QXE86245.1 ribosome silencing factor [Geomonas nitrogeniifigens]
MQDKEVMIPAVERAVKCAAFALDKKALDVKVLEIKNISSIADYLVLATGRSDRQVQAMADSVKQGLKPIDMAIDTEGYDEGRWVVVDFGDVIVHLFQEEVRKIYNLDELWSRAPQIEIPEEYLWEHKEK